MEASGNTINQHLEGFMQSVRKLEESLAAEKKKNQKIAQDYLATRTILENAARELQGRVGERDKKILERDQKISAISKAYRTLQAAGAQAKADALAAEERESKVLAELNQFKTAWGEVLARENQARDLILEHEKAKRILAEQRIRIHGLESSMNEANQAIAAHTRNAEIYRRELEATALRMQNAESRINQIQRDATAENQRVRGEAERLIQDERRTARAAAQELERIQAKLQATLDLNARLHSEMKAMTAARATDAARMTNDAARMANELTSLGAKLEATQRELAMQRMEAKNLETRVETVRKDSSKAALMTALRHEQEVTKLQSIVTQLMESGIYAEKIDEVPAGERIYSATPISIARSSLRGNVSDHAQNSAESPLGSAMLSRTPEKSV